MKPLTLLLADDHPIVLDGLLRILDHPEYRIVGMVNDGAALLQAATSLTPDVILADISMPLLTGIHALKRLREAHIPSKVIFLTMHADVPYAVEALTAGASGYVLKSSAGVELTRAIAEVLKGHTYISASLRDSVLLALSSVPHKSKDGGEPLSPRQREVLGLLAQGLGSKEIASRLNISRKTIDFHKHQMKQALGVQTIAELVVYAAHHGIGEE